MGKKSTILYLLKNMGKKHRLSVSDQHNKRELWYMFISPVRMFAGFLALVMVLFVIIITTVAYTPILDFIPGYPGNRSRELLVESIMRLDSMERAVNNAQIYGDNIALILEGKNPVMRTVASDDEAKRAEAPVSVKASVEDSLLREQIEGDGVYSLKNTKHVKKIETLNLIAPLKGVVEMSFDFKKERYGVGIVAKVGSEIVAVEDGNIISSMWTRDQGYVVQIQHNGNLVSIYKNCTNVLKTVGSRVRSGEVIAYVGEATSEGGRSSMYFELWQNGTALDPQNYVIF